MKTNIKNRFEESLWRRRQSRTECARPRCSFHAFSQRETTQENPNGIEDACKEQRPLAQRCWQSGGRGLVERAQQTAAAAPAAGRTPTRTFQTRPRNWLLLPALIAGLGLILAGRVTAQTFTTLYNFTAIDPNTYNYINSDGASP